MKRNRKRLLVISCIIVLIAFTCITFINTYLNNIRKVDVVSPDLSLLVDGDYQGEYTISPVDVEVKVSIENNQIIHIEILKHFNGLGKQAEAIIPLVLDQQSLNIESISGATVSSKCILKAIEDAMTKGLNNE